MALEGLIKDVRLDSVLLVLARGRKTGAVTLINGDTDGIIYISDGVPVDAMTGEEGGDAALDRLMGWNEGKFYFEENIVGGGETISVDTQERVLGELPLEDVLEEETETDQEEQQEPKGLLNIFHDVLEHSTQGISAVAVARLTEGDILACSSLIEGDRAMVTKGVQALQALKEAAVEVGRGDLEQFVLLDAEGWFVALRAKGDLYLACTAAKRAKLGQLLFHLKRICQWVSQLEL